jgi:hypothetical protein
MTGAQIIPQIQPRYKVIAVAGAAISVTLCTQAVQQWMQQSYSLLSVSPYQTAPGAVVHFMHSHSRPRRPMQYGGL